MSSYLICHKDFTPEVVSSAWSSPRDLDGTYFIYSWLSKFSDVPVGWEAPTDPYGLPTLTTAEMVAEVLSQMALGTAVIKVTRTVASGLPGTTAEP